MLILIVAEGPDKGRIYEWHDDQPVIVGRESKEVRLSDGKASRQHARFKCEGGKWYVRDLASRHGTLVNNIRTTGKHPLADGDRVRIGQTRAGRSTCPRGAGRACPPCWVISLRATKPGVTADLA